MCKALLGPTAQGSWQAPQIPRILGQELPHEQLVIFVRHAESRWNRAQAWNVWRFAWSTFTNCLVSDVRWIYWSHTFLASCVKDPRKDNLDVETQHGVHIPGKDSIIACGAEFMTAMTSSLGTQNLSNDASHLVFHRMGVNPFFPLVL